MKILGVDLGEKYIGLSLSDEEGKIAFPYKTLVFETWKILHLEIKDIIQKENIKEVVIGIPYNFSGNKKKTPKFKKFTSILKKEKIKIFEIDERLTTKQAETTLNSLGVSLRKNKEKVHQISASLILQTFLKQKVKQ
jgi:putative Holliday junction resolvase